MASLRIKPFFKKHIKTIRNVFLHCIGWLVFFAYPLVILDIPYELVPLWIRITEGVFTLILFYFNAYFLVPRLLLKRKYIMFTLSLVFVVLLFSVITTYSNEYIRDEKPKYLFQYQESVGPGHRHQSYSIQQMPPPNHEAQGRMWMREKYPRRMMFGLFFTLAISSSFGLVFYYFKEERAKKIIQNESLNSELSFLKSQINPHFLFNVLNNMYSLSLKKSDNLPSVILKLSEMMRYMLYDSERSKVALDNEIDYIKNYIELQKLRFFGNEKIIFEISGVTQGKTIAPMILIPFVENAFKHGLSQSHDSPIRFNLDIRGQNLFFKSANKIFVGQVKDETGGIGIQNVKRRLELIYPKNHTLTIQQIEEEYIVELEIRMNHDEMLNS